jgi:hypothetical protein
MRTLFCTRVIAHAQRPMCTCAPAAGALCAARTPLHRTPQASTSFSSCEGCDLTPLQVHRGSSSDPRKPQRSDARAVHWSLWRERTRRRSCRSSGVFSGLLCDGYSRAISANASRNRPCARRSTRPSANASRRASFVLSIARSCLKLTMYLDQIKSHRFQGEASGLVQDREEVGWNHWRLFLIRAERRRRRRTSR